MKLPDNVMLSEQIPYCKVQYSFEADPDHLPQITSPEQAYRYLLGLWDRDTIQYKEEFIILLLNSAKKCIGWSKISSGGSSATIVDPLMVIQVSALTNADSVILSHNHPSCRLKPSKSDINLTKRINSALKLVGVTLNDHLILSTHGYYSFRESGLI